jgi:hypothetical protein
MPRFARVLIAVASALLLFFAGAYSASANTFSTSGSAGSITDFTVGGTWYYQQHDGDDIAFNRTSGIAIDMRWASCKISGGTGAIKYNLHGEGARLLGTNFLNGSCLKLHYRGYSQTGSFNGVTYWNYNIA